MDIQVRGPGACPQVEGLASPQLVPVGWESHLALHIQNLHYFRVSCQVNEGINEGRVDSVYSLTLWHLHFSGSTCLILLLARAAGKTAEATCLPRGNIQGLWPHSLPGSAGKRLLDVLGSPTPLKHTHTPPPLLSPSSSYLYLQKPTLCWVPWACIREQGACSLCLSA